MEKHKKDHNKLYPNINYLFELLKEMDESTLKDELENLLYVNSLHQIEFQIKIELILDNYFSIFRFGWLINK